MRPESFNGLSRDFRRCAEITRHSSSNFYYAFMLLPAERRRALYSVYAFCRYLDDIADDGAKADPAVLLGRWREDLDRVFSGQATRPISRALAHTVTHFTIPRRHFEEVIAGVEMDLTRNRYRSFDELYLYCYRVASAVGLICVEIFGYKNPGTRVYAEKLGVAFQLTNILRDVREDAGRGRIYLPLDDLRRFGVEEREILEKHHSERFERLMEFEAGRADSYYQEAARALPLEDRSNLLTAEAMRLIYGAILHRIVASRYHVLEGRMSLSRPRKLYLVGRAWARGRLGLAL